jgi:hypothetical protein
VIGAFINDPSSFIPASNTPCQTDPGSALVCPNTQISDFCVPNPPPMTGCQLPQ